MVGDIKGYCVLRSTKSVWGYAGDLKDLEYPHCLRIIDIAVDNSGFLVLNPQGTALADIRDMQDVYAYFLCSEYAKILCPPDISFIEQWQYAAKRISLLMAGKYDRKMVICTSLTLGKLKDDFLFIND